MDKDALFEMLDIESGEDFQYFENFAELVEYDGDIDSGVMYELIGDVDMKTFAELCESYFYDTTDHLPDDAVDLYTLMDNIKRVLIGISESVRQGDEDGIVRLSDELNRFRLWYSADASVECVDGDSGEVEYMTVRDAIAAARAEQLDKSEHRFDFSDALEYELDEFMMTYADMADGEEEESEQ